MKNSILKAIAVAVLLLVNITSIAQIEKGKRVSSLGIIVDINDGEKSSPNQTEKTSVIKVSLQQGYFLSEKFAIGFGLGYLQNNRNTKREDGSYVKGTSSDKEVFLYGQYYKKIKGKFYYSPILLLNYFKQKGRSEEKAPSFNPVVSTFESNNYGIQINPVQFSFCLSNRFLLESGIGYIIIGKRTGEEVYPLETVTGSATAFKMNFSPLITQIKISLLF